MRRLIALRLAERSDEIEAAIWTRVQAISGPDRDLDPSYLQGLRDVVPAALGHALAAIERGERRPSPIPPSLLAQARLAQRNGVSLETVLRRYFGGYALFGDFLVEEAGKANLGGELLKQLLRTQAIYFDRLLAAVSEEYEREAKSRPASTEQERVERVKRLLAGELVDASELAYDFEGHHLGLIAQGEGVEEAIRGLAAKLDRRLLMVSPQRELRWAWLSGRRSLGSEKLGGALANWPKRVALAVGEPAEGLAGWRVSHSQAGAALPIALESRRPTTYAEVALIASIRGDELLCASLRQLYLEPLEGAPGGGEVLRETLRAYFAAGRNVSSAAAVLGVNRNTVARRLHAIEDLLGRALETCALELEVTFRLEELAEASTLLTPVAVR